MNDLSTRIEDLGWQVDGEWFRCPSPGQDAEDRSCVFKITRGQPWIYECNGLKNEAYAMLREKLDLPAFIQRDYSQLALRIWDESRPVSNGRPVENYLRARGITLPVPDTLRYYPGLRHTPTNCLYDAMVALVTNKYGTPIAIHRTWLSHDSKSTAPVDDPKMTLGKVTGGAIRLAPIGEHLLIGEGIETCLSAMQIYGIPAWSSVSAYGLYMIELPDEVRKVTILVDNDDYGQGAAEKAAWRLLNIGLRVSLAHSEIGKDFNDQLMRNSK
jgi:putative DNA primase/helicase